MRSSDVPDPRLLELTVAREDAGYSVAGLPSNLVTDTNWESYQARGFAFGANVPWPLRSAQRVLLKQSVQILGSDNVVYGFPLSGDRPSAELFVRSNLVGIYVRDDETAIS